jgi:hypothetical protein
MMQVGVLVKGKVCSAQIKLILKIKAMWKKELQRL